jgi:hypothetical protein
MLDFLRGLFGLSRKSDAVAADLLRAAGEAEPEREPEVSVIRSCRERFGDAPREFRTGDRITLDPELERAFVESNDGLLRILQDQDALLTRGRVVWGQLVQANQILFNPQNRLTCPANAIYSTDPFFDGRLALLGSMAGGLYAQKGSKRANRELQGFVDAVTNEMARVLRREMPRSYTGGRPVCFATCFIQPAHLPHGYLNRSSFPVIVNPEETPTMMLLPARYWPPDLVSHWRCG